MNYVGEPPSLEVTISNLNDNIDRQFLTDMVNKFGEQEELTIYYHPVTNKHLGLARVVFMEVQSAKQCVASLNNKSVMGKQLRVFLDPFGKIKNKKNNLKFLCTIKLFKLKISASWSIIILEFFI